MAHSTEVFRRSIADDPAIGIHESKHQPSQATHPPRLQIQPEYVVVVNSMRKYVEVSPAFCKLLGYEEKELIGKRYDEVTTPQTNDSATIMNMLVKIGYMHGIWVFSHRGGTKILVRYESFARADGMYEAHMELLGAGA